MEQLYKQTGKVPPIATDVEAVVLGAMLIDGNSIDEAFAILRMPDIFYNTKNLLVFSAIDELFKKGNPIDLRTVSHQLRTMGKLEEAGGDFYLIGLTQKVASAAHIEYHCRILVQYYIKRRLIFINAQITSLCYDDATDVFDLIDGYQKSFDSLVDVTSKGRKTMSFSKALDHLKEEIEVLSANTDDVQLVGKTTGFKRTDKHTGGYRNQDLVIIAARPGMGKTAKVLKTAIANAVNGVPVGIISLEMSIHQLTARSVALDTDFHLGQLLKYGFEKTSYFERYDQHVGRMKEYPLYIDDSGESDITEVVITAKMWKRVYGIGLLVVDYLQLMGDKSVKGNRETEISSISRRLKKLAKELDLPIIALSQLSRAVETRGGSKRPMLSDLRESGAIEQDADIVEFIYRPGYYNIEMNEDEYDNMAHKKAISMGADTEIIYAKYRGGSTGTALLRWVGDKTKFVDVEDENDTVDYVGNTSLKISPSEAFDNDNEETVFDS